MKKAIFLCMFLVFVAISSISCLTNPTGGSDGDSNTGSSVTPNADKYPCETTYNGANYNFGNWELGTTGPNGGHGGVGLYNIWYEASTRYILYSSGGAGSVKVAYNVILSTKGASSMKTLTSKELSYASALVGVPENSVLCLAIIESTVSISADTRIYVQFTQWTSSTIGSSTLTEDNAFYVGTFTPAEFNQ